ncbi:MAG: type II toxin-antitoxin system RelB/DinJ family antitoxin [Longimicrobiaceae bacterium]
MAKTAMIRARVEPELKAQAEAILRGLGLSATDAITLFYHQVVQHRGLPFEVRRANAAPGEPANTLSGAGV